MSFPIIPNDIPKAIVAIEEDDDNDHPTVPPSLCNPTSLDDDYGLIMVDEEQPIVGFTTNSESDTIPSPKVTDINHNNNPPPSKTTGFFSSLFGSSGNLHKAGTTSSQLALPSTLQQQQQQQNHTNTFHRRIVSAPQLQGLTTTTTLAAEQQLDLSQTEHHQQHGILASRADLNLPPAQFAAGCQLLQAAAVGNLTQLEDLLQSGATHGNFRDYDRRTALHVAASEGHVHVCACLLQKYGVQVNRSDRWGGSPLDDAHRHRHSAVVQLLRQHGATTGCGHHGTQLIQAAFEGDLDELQLLLLQSGSVNAVDYDRRTALHLAAGEGHVAVVRALCEAGADVNAEDRWKRRPLDDACAAENHDHVEAVLRDFGAQHGPDLSTHHATQDERRMDDNMKVDFAAEIELIDRIGQGAFGEIYKCRWRGTLVAAKIIKSAKIIRRDWLHQRLARLQESPNNGELVDDALHQIDQQDQEQPLSDEEQQVAMMEFRREISLLKSLRHPHIVLLLAYSTTENHECLLSELMKCSLLDVFKSHIVQGTSMSYVQQISYATQLVLGMNYLHTCKPPIVHRDLKPANLLIDHSGILKISDFGLSKLRPTTKKETERFVMTGETGSYRFMAPECYRHEDYTETVDVYSFAMILFYLLVGRPPWPHLSGLDAVRLAAEEGDRPAIPRNLDARMTAVLHDCWNEHPTRRPSFSSLTRLFQDYNQSVFQASDMVELNSLASTQRWSSCCVIL